MIPVAGDGFAEYVQQQLDDAWPGTRFEWELDARRDALELRAETPTGARLTRSIAGQVVRVCKHKRREQEFSRRLAGEVGALCELVANARTIHESKAGTL